MNYRYWSRRYLHDYSDCFRLERIAGWASHPLESAAFFTAQAESSHLDLHSRLCYEMAEAFE